MFNNKAGTTFSISSVMNIICIVFAAFFCFPATAQENRVDYIRSVKLYKQGDQTSFLVFSRRMVVVDNQAAISAQVQQPYNSSLFKTAQKLQISMQPGSRIQAMSPNDFKVVILQNKNWQTSLFIDRPTISRGNYY